MRAVERSGRRDAAKEQHWRAAMGRRERSGLSVRAFCAREGLKASRYYDWQRRLRGRAGTEARGGRSRPASGSSFLLIDPRGGATKSGLELVLRDGRRLEIGSGVDAETLRMVLAVLEPERC